MQKFFEKQRAVEKDMHEQAKQFSRERAQIDQEKNIYKMESLEQRNKIAHLEKEISRLQENLRLSNGQMEEWRDRFIYLEKFSSQEIEALGQQFRDYQKADCNG